MGDNATVYVASKCHDCKKEIRIHMNGKNEVEVDCREMISKNNPEGTTMPKMKCDFFRLRRD